MKTERNTLETKEMCSKPKKARWKPKKHVGNQKNMLETEKTCWKLKKHVRNQKTHSKPKKNTFETKKNTLETKKTRSKPKKRVQNKKNAFKTERTCRKQNATRWNTWKHAENTLKKKEVPTHLGKWARWIKGSPHPLKWAKGTATRIGCSTGRQVVTRASQVVSEWTGWLMLVGNISHGSSGSCG